MNIENLENSASCLKMSCTFTPSGRRIEVLVKDAKVYSPSVVV